MVIVNCTCRYELNLRRGYTTDPILSLIEIRHRNLSLSWEVDIFRLLAVAFLVNGVFYSARAGFGSQPSHYEFAS